MPGNSRQSEKMLSSILQAMPFPVLLARLADSTVLYINPLAAEQLKLSPGKIQGQYALDFYLNPGDRPPLVERVMKEGRLCNYEVQFKNSEGQAFWALLSCQMFTYGQDQCLLTTFTNINEQKHNEEKLRLAAKVLENTSESIVVTDAQGIVVDVNPAFTASTGYSRKEALGQTTRELLHSDEHDAETYASMGKTVYKKGQWQGEIWSQRKNGEFYPERLSINSILSGKGDITHYLSISTDISEQKRNEERLYLAAKVLENTSESIVITDAQGIVVDVNPAFTASTGYSREAALGQTTRALLHSDERDAETYARMGQAIYKKGQWQGEIWSQRKNGEFYPERLSISTITNEKGEISHYLSISSDISEKKRDEERLSFLANYDALTLLPNRNLFNLHLKDALFQAQRYRRLLALLFIDLDHFKPINDSLGHDAGDSLLKEVASRLRSNLRQSDNVARFGGDEFLVLIPQYPEISGVVLVTKKILREIERPFMICNKECRISASIGISLHPEDGSDAETLLKKADSAMYRAKEKGKNTFEFFSPICDSQAQPASSPQQNT
jgi:diguanylate cyclase (GGDEF)-like protein/PAS domain S-box-containing protein